MRDILTAEHLDFPDILLGVPAAHRAYSAQAFGFLERTVAFTTVRQLLMQ